ncbi:hypothetical protein [Synechococcus sp. CBW1004]|jgi:hypothetical protein|uniref:hypothetical protein n=1 Tax=Synechococcus sp. CBW1004 TaxID=1353136 RepID=UPI0018CD6BCF|nr:hypothetical protein [Synechococcus sp. CBW1004]QPN63042.1 hypothetical protein H8F25_15685 [Synechococcus sp. CBW1004]
MTAAAPIPVSGSRPPVDYNRAHPRRFPPIPCVWQAGGPGGPLQHREVEPMTPGPGELALQVCHRFVLDGRT